MLIAGQSTVLGMPSEAVGFKIPQAEAVFPPNLCFGWHIGLKQVASPQGSLKRGWKLAALSWLPERVYQTGVLLHCPQQQASILEGLELWSDFSYIPGLST